MQHMEEKEPTRRFSIELPVSLEHRIRIRAKLQGRSKIKEIERMLLYAEEQERKSDEKVMQALLSAMPALNTAQTAEAAPQSAQQG